MNPNNPNPSNLSVVNPLSIILVKNGSKGDRLLFRYPYKDTRPKPVPKPKRKERLFPEPAVLRSRKISDIFISSSPHTPQIPDVDSFDDSLMSSASLLSHRTSGGRSSSSSGKSRKTSRTSPISGLFGNKGPGPLLLDKTGNSDVFSDLNSQQERVLGGDKFSPGGSGNEMLNELSDKDLSNLLAVNTDLSERKFELKLNYVRFVGHPTLMHHPKDIRPINPLFQTSVRLFHIVFCLNAVASHSIVKCFHDLSKRIGIALRHEEYRCGFDISNLRKHIDLLSETSFMK